MYYVCSFTVICIAVCSSEPWKVVRPLLAGPLPNLRCFAGSTRSVRSTLSLARALHAHLQLRNPRHLSSSAVAPLGKRAAAMGTTTLAIQAVHHGTPLL